MAVQMGQPLTPSKLFSRPDELHLKQTQLTPRKRFSASPSPKEPIWSTPRQLGRHASAAAARSAQRRLSPPTPQWGDDHAALRLSLSTPQRGDDRPSSRLSLSTPQRDEDSPASRLRALLALEQNRAEAPLTPVPISRRDCCCSSKRSPVPSPYRLLPTAAGATAEKRGLVIRHGSRVPKFFTPVGAKKRAKAVRKTLRHIEALRGKVASGGHLDDKQLVKLERRLMLEQELKDAEACIVD